ncbi:hypothetical protein M2153_003379 [Pseudomonas sp. JUb96]|nr:hypothetical protein [Pseudomonas sp. JUb96]
MIMASTRGASQVTTRAGYADSPSPLSGQ